MTGGKGANGANGGHETFEDGGTGRAGAALSSVTVSATGLIQVGGAGTGGHGIAVDVTAGNGGAGGGSTCCNGGNGGGGTHVSIGGAGQIDVSSDQSSAIHVLYKDGTGGGGAAAVCSGRAGTAATGASGRR